MNEIMTTKEVASYTRLSESFFKADRCYGWCKGRLPGPPFIKLGRKVVYRKEDVDDWIMMYSTKKKVMPNSEAMRPKG